MLGLKSQPTHCVRLENVWPKQMVDVSAYSIETFYAVFENSAINFNLLGNQNGMHIAHRLQAGVSNWMFLFSAVVFHLIIGLVAINGIKQMIL